ILERIKGSHPGYKTYVLVCGGGTCRSGDISGILEAFAKEAEAKGIMETTAITKSPCLGVCEQVPNIYIGNDKGGTIYNNITPEAVKTIVEKHIINGEIAEEFLPRLEGAV
ncbi:MAG: (2Fe-2S) ferredoxin domain-containing protein, partial [Defluviitaleaceae bacterium]|nr:(2Fe-2S) ferredoxin domain-containing protein [Defluviitaleaceae bacterium]